MAKTTFDCARVPHETCSLQLTGERHEVLPAAEQHITSAHPHAGGEQLKTNVANAVDEPEGPKVRHLGIGTAGLDRVLARQRLDCDPAQLGEFLERRRHVLAEDHG